MVPIVFGVIGGGWRSEFFFRVAQALPERYHCAGVYMRNAAKAEQVQAAWGVRTTTSLEELLGTSGLHFVIISVPRAVCPDYIQELARRGIPALAETPPAADLDGLLALYAALPPGAADEQPEPGELLRLDFR